MRILYLSDHGPHSCTFIRQDVELMSKMHEVLYLCFVSDKHYPGKKIVTSIVEYPIHNLKSRLMWRLENAGIYSNWFNNKFSKSLYLEIEKFKPDIIHCQFAYEGIKYFDNIDLNIPVVINFRGYDASYKLRNSCYVKKMKKILARKNVFPVFVCEALMKNVNEKGIKFNEKYLKLYTGVDTSLFQRKNTNLPQGAVFIQTGSFNDKKGHEITVKAFHKFLQKSKKNDSKLIFIGDGVNLIKIKQIVKELDLTGNVIFTGKLTSEEIVRHLDEASVFVHHSITASNGDMEGIPNAIIEAMAMELPVLSTYHSGIPEAVTSGVNGFLSNEGDVETLSNQMQDILSFGYLRINRDKVKEQFCINKHIAFLNEFYQKIIEI
jgi:colanic acid/amylovoran biosynthesis glycosyltransferase